MRRLSRVLSFSLCVLLLTTVNVWAEDELALVNQIVGIDVGDADGQTAVTIQGTAGPTFSVYQLSQPPRIFVDFSNTEIGGQVTNWPVRNGVVDEVLVLQYQDEVSLVTRVVISLEQEESEYDVLTQDNNVTILFSRVSPGAVASAQDEQEGFPLTEEILVEYEAALRSVQGYQVELANQESEIAQLETERSYWQREVRDLEEVVEAMATRELEQRGIISDLSGRAESSERELTLAQERENEAQEALSDARGILISLEAQATTEQQSQDRNELDAQINEMESALTQLEAAAQEAATRRQQAAQDALDAEAQLSAVANELTSATMARQEAQQLAQEAHEDLEDIQLEVATHNQSQTQIEIQLSSSTAELENLETQRTSLQQDIDASQMALAQQQQTRMNMEDEIQTARTSLNTLADERSSLETELNGLRGQVMAAQQSRNNLENEAEDISSELSVQTAERGRVEGEIDAASSQLVELETQLTELESNRDRVYVQEAENQELALGELETMISESEEALEELGRTRAQAMNDLERLANQLNTMENEIQQRTELQDELDEVEALLGQRLQEQSELERTVEDTEAQLAVLEEERYSTEEVLVRIESQAAGFNEQSPSGTGSDVALADRVDITDVRFEQVDGVDRILVAFSGEGAEVMSLPWDANRAGLLISGANLPHNLRRTLDAREYSGPVRYISTFDTGNGDVRVVAELSHAGSEILTHSGSMTTWAFSPADEVAEVNSASAGSSFQGYNSAEEGEAETAPSLSRSGLAFTIGELNSNARSPRLSRRYRVTIDVVNAEIQNVLRLFSDQGDVNIIASGDVQGTITLRLRNVPLDQAFGLILQSMNLGFEQVGNIIRVAPRTEFEADRQRELDRIAMEFDVEPLQIRLRPISYAEGNELASLVEDVLSSRGSVRFDTRTTTLVMTDVTQNLDAAEQLIDALDTQTPQVLIEARIVQTSESLTRGFGIQWGGDTLFSAANGNPTGLLFPSTVGIAGGAGQDPNSGTSTQPNYAVNIPGSDLGSIGFQFGSLGQAVNLNLRLSAAEQSGEAKVVSAPRILTLSGMQASISSGVSIPIQSSSAAGTAVRFAEANLQLDVVPTVNPDGYINMTVTVTKNEPDFSRTGANGDPSIITREANTVLLVRDGETSVIGGIFEHSTGSSQNAVPFFADIPILGALFRDYNFSDSRNETLVFITPRIVNREASLSNYTPGSLMMAPDRGSQETPEASSGE
jgi:type IV pilus assembly protein PilQ